MFRTTRYLVAALVLASAVSACTAAASTTAPSALPAATALASLAPTAPPATAAPAVVPSVAASASAEAGATGGPVAAGGNFCGLLGPGDFAAVGVAGARTPTKNSDGPSDAYCVYSGISGATGGIEFDIFIGDPMSSYQQILQNGTLVADPTTGLVGVDNVGTVLVGPGNMAAIGVQKGAMTFDIDVPTGPNARAQLIALAKLVIERGSGLSR